MQPTTVFICMAIVFHQAIVSKAQVVDIVQTAINNANFATLVSALTAADLVTTLKGTGPFTVFAPTNAAFSKLPAGTLVDLLKPENKGSLARILKYHVINNQNLTAALINGLNLPTTVQMLDGGGITVSRDGSSLKVNDATVIIPDVIATNGIIHAIDTVLMPSSSATYSYINHSLLLLLVCTISISFLRFP